MSRTTNRLGLGLLLAGMVGATAWAGPSNGQTAPDFDGKDLRSGDRVELEDFRGKVVLVDFWATWCPPCRAEIPHVKSAYDKFNDQGFEIISISLDRNMGELRGFILKEQMRWIHLLDRTREISKRYDVSGIPAMFLVDRDGKIVASGSELRSGRLEDQVKKAVEADWEGAAELNEKGLAALAKADKLRDDGKVQRALEAYEKIADEYAGTEAAKQALERMRTIKSDPNFQQKRSAAKAQGDIDKWLRFARTMRDAGQNSLAEKYYQKIIDEYPDASEAETAKKELAELEDAG